MAVFIFLVLFSFFCVIFFFQILLREPVLDSFKELFNFLIATHMKLYYIECPVLCKNALVIAAEWE